MKNKIANISMITGVILILLSVSLLVYNQLEDNRAEKATKELMHGLEQEIKEAQEDKEVPDSVEADVQTMPTVKVEGHEYIGYIYIPELSLKLPVMSDWSYAKLRVAPCRYSGAIHTNDMVIAAHNYAKHFGRIKNLSQGSQVIFVDMKGIGIEYEVVEMNALKPADVEDMTAGEFDLTLFTCNYSGQSRIAVRCDRKTK